MTNAGGHGFRVKAHFVGELPRAVNGAKNDTVTEGQGFGEGVLKHATAHGVRTWFKHRPQAPSRPAEARGVNGYANGSRVVGEVVHDENVVDFSLHIHSTFYALKSCQGFLNGLAANAAAL